MNKFSGKNILITGGTRGIGLATAKAFLKEGANVLITGRSNSVFEIAKNISAKGIIWDMEDIDCFDIKLEEALSLMGHIDILINNAGVLTGKDDTGTFKNTSVSDFMTVMNVNVRGVFFLSQIVSKHMIKEKIHGHIVNVCSNMGFRMISDTPYGMSKWAVRGLTLGMGYELARDGIIVNGIAPGPVTTDMMGFKEGQENHFPHIPIERYSTPDEIANTILFLADSDNIVGDLIIADGGERLY